MSSQFARDRLVSFLRFGRDVFGQKVGHDALVKWIPKLERMESFTVQDGGDFRGRIAGHMKFSNTVYQSVKIRFLPVSVYGASDFMLTREAARPLQHHGNPVTRGVDGNDHPR